MRQGGRRRLFFWLALVAVVLWMAVIFSFSAQRDTESSEVSGRVSYRIVESVNGVFRLEMTEEAIRERALSIELPVRKFAHMGEYAILGWLVLLSAFLCRDVGTGKKKRICFRYLPALATVFLYACTDEFHQRFVPGRAGRFVDVLIDTLGAFLGLALVFVLANCYNRRKRKNEFVNEVNK